MNGRKIFTATFSLIVLFMVSLVDGGCPWWKFWSISYVTIEQGRMCGLKMKSFSGREFISFRAIPFALPPVGNLRFKAPVPLSKWEGTLDATKDGPVCIQTMIMFSQTLGVEDCLYLNVYTPKLPRKENSTGMDVMVWIFAGAFYFGSGVSAIYPPNFIMNKDVVLVTMNYRLGAFGFLSTGDDVAPGNYGMKDQVLALKWVQKNIAAFGGNPASVTIFGYSSGGSSVHFHMLSPASVGLFHRAISMDGTALSPFAETPDIEEQYKKQGHLVGCPTNSTHTLIDCLRETDAVKISLSLSNLFSWWVTATSGYAPVVENKTENNPDPFLVENPLDSLRNGNFQKVPWIAGGASEPGLIFTASIMNVGILEKQLNQYRYDILRKVFLLQLSVPKEKVPELLDTVLQNYFGKNSSFNSQTFENYTEMISDYFFLFPVHKSAQLHARAGHKSVYLYNMAYRGFFSSTITSSLKNYGVSHGDPVVYMFPFFNLPPGTPDSEFREMFITMWTSFAKYGTPTPTEKTGNPIVDELKWLPVGDVNLEDMHLRYLNIGQVMQSPFAGEYLNLGLGPVKLNMAQDLYKKRMDFWDSLPIFQNCLTNCN